MDEIQTVVVGAGVVGLAVARRLAMAGHEVIVVEKTEAIGTGVSSRNSEVIHAGIYYEKGSNRALFCVHGKHALYRYCESHGVPHRRCGKLIVATSAEEDQALSGIRDKAAANGVADLEFLDAARAMALEPNVRCTGALLSPSTGIVDSHALMLAFQGDAEAHGAMLAFHAPVEHCAVAADGIEVTMGGETPMTLRARNLVNCAGLGAPGLAAATEGLASEHKPRGHIAKGSYFTLPGRPPFGRLIYPVPVAAWLGVHVTIDLGGQVKFGPDLEWIEEENYDVDPARADVFYEAVRRYFPDLEDGALQPGYVGIRPRLYGKGEPTVDFQVHGAARHGIRGLVNLFGIESPGLTAAMAIAEHVAVLLGASNRDPLRGEAVEFGLG